MNLEIASSFLEGALFSMLLPITTLIALVTWYFRAARHLQRPEDQATAAPSAPSPYSAPEGPEPTA